MPDLIVSPIVEGHGEVSAVRTLLQRIWIDSLQQTYVDVLQPIRRRRSNLLTSSGMPRPELRTAVEFAGLSLRCYPRAGQHLILVLLDSEGGCPATIAPRMYEYVRQTLPTIPRAVVLAHHMYETWFVGSAESLRPELIFDSESLPKKPETKRFGKGWIVEHMRQGVYSETVDQARFTARIDIEVCRARCPSFEKLHRELQRFVA